MYKPVCRVCFFSSEKKEKGMKEEANEKKTPLNQNLINLVVLS
jgi:hypothetical protein